MYSSLPLSQLSIPFINAMVQTMYAEEAKQSLNPNLLNEEEMFDLYWSYMGFPL